jgi:hypothetical protein
MLHCEEYFSVGKVDWSQILTYHVLLVLTHKVEWQYFFILN